MAFVLQRDLKTEQVQMKYKTQAEQHPEARALLSQQDCVRYVSWNHTGQCLASDQQLNPEVTFHQGDSGAAEGTQTNSLTELCGISVTQLASCTAR